MLSLFTDRQAETHKDYEKKKLLAKKRQKKAMAGLRKDFGSAVSKSSALPNNSTSL